MLVVINVRTVLKLPYEKAAPPPPPFLPFCRSGTPVSIPRTTGTNMSVVRQAIAN